jgi:hypothetical protein
MYYRRIKSFDSGNNEKLLKIRSVIKNIDA